jgi:hypothetical protein
MTARNHLFLAPSARAAVFGLAILALTSAAVGCSKRRHAPEPSPTDPSEPAAAAVDSFDSTNCDAFLAGQESKFAASAKCSPTERLAFQKSPKCLDCLLRSTCLDDQVGESGQECESTGSSTAADDFGAGSSEEKQCLAVLACDLGLTPPSTTSVIHGGPNAGPLRGFCGDKAVMSCWKEGATGACKGPIAAGFPGTMDAQQMSINIAQRRFPSGRAGRIVGCGDNNDCKSCFE